MASSSTLVFFVNGNKIVEENADPEWTLLYYLRNKLNLCGTKLGCAEGGCGACTVMVSRINRENKSLVHFPVNACLSPVCSMHGMAVTTVEGIGSTKTKLHPVQERIAKAHGSQCGFCTPGIVMSMYTLLRNTGKPAMNDLEIAFQGNLCRCTGYRPIIEGFRTFTEEEIYSCGENGAGGECPAGSQCCRNKLNGSEDKDVFSKSEFTPYDPSQEPIFPPELKLSPALDNEVLKIEGKRTTWYRPLKLQHVLLLKERYPHAQIVVGNTEIGVDTKFKNRLYPVLIHPSHISELTSMSKTDIGLRVGASVTIEKLEMALRREMKTEPEHKTRVFSAILGILHWFAGKQIRNVAAIGGNIMAGSPIADLNPILMAANAKLFVEGKARGGRILPMDHSFFTGYRKNVIQPDEILIAILIPYSEQDQYFYSFKQARRRDDDIAIVNFSMNVFLNSTSLRIKNIALVYGGVGPTTVMARKTQEKLIGEKWDDSLPDKAYCSLLDEIRLAADAPGGMVQYRSSLVLSLFFKAYITVCQQLQSQCPNAPQINQREQSASRNFGTLEPCSSQYFQVVSDQQQKTDPVGRPIVHKSAFKQATGEAVFCDDIPHFEKELYLALVLSTKAHARIVSIDPTQAFELEGVRNFFSAKDLKGERNMWGPIVHDDEIFAKDVVTCQGQPIGAVVAETQSIAQQAAKLIKIEYEEMRPVITIEDAIEKKSFFPGFSRIMKKGDVEKAFASADHVISGEVRLAGQEHFYLETNCCLAVPTGEEDELHIYISSQNPAEAQKLVAEMLEVPANRIVCHVKRLGGGFGGKESRFNIVSLPVALAAHRLQCPVRCMLDRDEDMLVSGQRHPFLGRYKAAFTKEGKILGYEVEIYNNGGMSMDLSAPVLERSIFHAENSYFIPNIKITGFICRTNIPSNTAFRGFGGPQGMFFAENMIRDIAAYLKRDPIEISQMNLYKEGDLTQYNQKLVNCTLQRCWEECLHRANYAARRNDVQNYNRQNRWKKRGLSVVPTKFGIAFTVKFLNQAGALAHVYTDGSVLLSHGGTEMGQGLHTKMIQVASRALGIPDSYIHISETATDKVANTSATAASASSDLNGMAVLNACAAISQRLEPFKKANPGGSWEEWVKAAYLERVSLSATGFYRTPNIGYDWNTNEGNAFNYFTYGVACSEVEIDCLTGDHQVLRTDIVMDLGESLNPAIDIGQVEGAFMQGYGLFTLEEPLVTPSGELLTRGPGTYKLPGFSDIPGVFNVSLLTGAPNPRAVYSSKAVGEPPLFLASSVFFAIKDAIEAARKEEGLVGNFRLDSPATAARIRVACEDRLVKSVPLPDPSATSWSVLA